MWTKSIAGMASASLALVCVAATGCRDLAPDVFHPGPASYQRKQAELTDPYPEPDTAPDMVGARPRDYQKPPAEVTRSRNFNPRFQQQNAAPPPVEMGLPAITY